MFESMYSEAQKKAAEGFILHTGDYEKDGEVYCANCHTKRAALIENPFTGERQLHYCKCRCEMDEIRQEEEHRRQVERAERIKMLKSVGFTDAAMRGWTFSKDDRSNPKISTVALNFVQNFSTMRDQGKGLLFYGTVGTGKTFFAACIANALIERSVPCLMTSFPRILNTLYGTKENKQEYLDKINDCDLLIIDDFSAERQTEYAQEVIYEVIDSRYRTGYPLIVTTNLTASELLSPATIGKKRVYSRLLNMCVPVEVDGVDRRTNGSDNGDMLKLAELLGL